MAYVSKELKAELSPAIKAVLKKYKMKGSIAVDNHSSLVVNVASGPIDFGTEHTQVNHYHLDRNYSGTALEFLKELHSAMSKGNFDESDAMTDYFHVGWYIDINIGRWSKPYQVIS